MIPAVDLVTITIALVAMSCATGEFMARIEERRHMTMPQSRDLRDVIAAQITAAYAAKGVEIVSLTVGDDGRTFFVEAKEPVERIETIHIDMTDDE